METFIREGMTEKMKEEEKEDQKDLNDEMPIKEEEKKNEEKKEKKKKEKKKRKKAKKSEKEIEEDEEDEEIESGNHGNDEMDVEMDEGERKKELEAFKEDIKILFRPGRLEGCGWSKKLPKHTCCSPHKYQVMILSPLNCPVLKPTCYLLAGESRKTSDCDYERLGNNDSGVLVKIVNPRTLIVEHKGKNVMRFNIWLQTSYGKMGSKFLKLVVEDSGVLLYRGPAMKVTARRNAKETAFWDVMLPKKTGDCDHSGESVEKSVDENEVAKKEKVKAKPKKNSEKATKTPKVKDERNQAQTKERNSKKVGKKRKRKALEEKPKVVEGESPSKRIMFGDLGLKLDLDYSQDTETIFF